MEGGIGRRNGRDRKVKDGEKKGQEEEREGEKDRLKMLADFSHVY